LTLVVPARAKLNLDLAVLGRTDDGYHAISTQMQAIALHDLLQLTPADRSASMPAAKTATLTIAGLPQLDVAENSVLKAHAAMQDEAGRELPTHFHLDKRIPLGAGMGGASSDAAAALRGLAAIHNLNNIDLMKIAARIGADVPFFLSGGAARAEGRGERLTKMPMDQDQEWFAIAWPGIELSTADVYCAWDEVKGDGPNHLTLAAARVEPRLQVFAKRLGRHWQMTGSGSAFFRRFPNEEAARKATEDLDCWTAATHAIGPWA
jgi:4-diphosphocytidyl-2-C-methyl-D-erythritol kinase